LVSIFLSPDVYNEKQIKQKQKQKKLKRKISKGKIPVTKQTEASGGKITY